ncbi:MAG: hypothetical protein V1813_00640 [Candidatus Aenigmatarchaeota archaeon]
MKMFAQKLGRFYLQFLMIIAIGACFAYVLNGIFMVGDDKSRILFSAVFLLLFSGALVAIEKVL